MTDTEVDGERARLLRGEEHGESTPSAQDSPNRIDDTETEAPKTSNFTLFAVVPVLLLGVFVASADGSLVIATSPHIASEFRSLSNASWLVTSFVLAQCASQPLYGKLSDIFGRKSNLVSAYTLFTIGCFICGAATKFWHIILGRAISGIGGAGMVALVSVIITDMVPVRDVAAWRSYVNVSATCGRALGGPVGGWLTDSVGWRWSFYGQCPLTVLAIILVMWRLPTQGPDVNHEDDNMSDKLRRIDSVGAIVLAGTISAFLLFTDIASKAGLLSIETICIFATFVIGCAVFYVVEKHWAKEPILPLHLITKPDALIPYLISAFQLGAQFGAFYCYPIYFQISAGMSSAAAGSRLVPSVCGNAVGGLLSGWIISRTGRYKPLTALGSGFACLAYLLVVIRFRGHTAWPELLYTVPGGLGTGIIQSTAFVHLAAAFDHSDMAIVGTTLYLSMNVGLLVGINLATAVFHGRLATTLRHDLAGTPHARQIIDRSISNLEYIWGLPDDIKRIVVSAYVDSLRWSFGLSLALAFTGLVIGLFMRERKL